MQYQLKFFIPLFIFILIVIFLWEGLGLNPRYEPTLLLNKKIPSFGLSQLYNPNKKITIKDIHGKVILLNFFASWCITCRLEHHVLMMIKEKNILPIYGIAYKDKRSETIQWLSEKGNPFQRVGQDIDGRMSIAFGVFGTPETFLIDKGGIIRYKRTGIITKKIWQNELLPLIQKLQRS